MGAQKTETKSKSAAKKKAPTTGMTLEKAYDVFSRTHSGGKVDLSHIYEFYHPDMVFRDSIQEVRGREPFIEMSERLVSRCEKLEMVVHNVAQNGDTLFVEWTMSMAFRRTPMTPMHGTTRLTLDEDGLILVHRDYFDLWGDTLDATPIGNLYRSFMHRMFG